jgi:hypothetical protein
MWNLIVVVRYFPLVPNTVILVTIGATTSCGYLFTIKKEKNASTYLSFLPWFIFYKGFLVMIQ